MTTHFDPLKVNLAKVNQMLNRMIIIQNLSGTGVGPRQILLNPDTAIGDKNQPLLNGFIGASTGFKGRNKVSGTA